MENTQKKLDKALKRNLENQKPKTEEAVINKDKGIEEPIETETNA